MTEDLVSNHERTQDIYEQLPSYPKPPLIPVPEWGDWESLREMGIKLNAFSLFLIKTAMFFIGFRSFYKKLPQTMEHLMRTSNMRGAGLFATINSASLALARDKRNLSAAERAAAAAINSDPVEKPAEAQELNWQIADAAIERARKNIEPVIDNQQATFVIDGIGKTLFRQYGLQPVPVFMLAIDMAVRKHTGKHGAISQYLSMSKYRCMNLANANSTTAEVKRFTEFTEQENFNTTEAFALMKEAVKSQIDAYRSARKYLSMSNMISLFLNSKKGFAKVAVSLLLGLVIFKLKIFGLYKSEAPEIPASHPDIFPEVPVVGRPGIKLPYIRYFGFHYQIMDDKTIITYMPSTRWRVSNKELTETIKEKAGILKTILEMNK